MRVIDLINSNEKTAFSFEILPPLKGTGIEKLYQTIDTLREFDPKYINITTHRSEYVYKDLGNGWRQDMGMTEVFQKHMSASKPVSPSFTDVPAGE